MKLKEHLQEWDLDELIMIIYCGFILVMLTGVFTEMIVSQEVKEYQTIDNCYDEFGSKIIGLDCIRTVSVTQQVLESIDLYLAEYGYCIFNCTDCCIPVA